MTPKPTARMKRLYHQLVEHRDAFLDYWDEQGIDIYAPRSDER